MTPQEPASILDDPSVLPQPGPDPADSRKNRLTGGDGTHLSPNQLGRDISLIMIAGMRVADVVFIVAAGWLAHILQVGQFVLPQSYIVLTVAAALVASQIMQAFDGYRFDELSMLLLQLRRILMIWTLTILLVLSVLFFLQVSEGFSRQWVGLWWVFGLIGMSIIRGVMAHLRNSAREAGLLTRRVAIVGGGDIGQWLLSRLQDNRNEPVEIVGVFDDRMQRFQAADTALPIRGTVADLIVFLRENAIDMVVIALPSQAVDRLEHLVRSIRVLPVEVHVCPGRIGFNLERSEVVTLGGIPLLKVSSRPLDKGGWLIKQVEDYVVASLILLLITPVLLAIALAIRLDSPGPVLFTQRRVGFNGHSFIMFKFRSMRVATAEEAAQVRQARPGDDRITKVGRILRRYSLDELPQFFNVLKGDMSVVGPRPHAERHDQIFAQYIGDYPSRAKVKPGLTGWAQINGFRGLTDSEEKIRQRVEYDLWYIENWSLALDLRIILQTAFWGMTSRNAH